MKKINVKLVLVLEMILLVLVIFYLTLLSSNQLELSWLIDFPALLGIFIFVIPSMIFMGVFKDFIKAFSVGQKHYRLLELKNILEAVKVCQKLVLFGGLTEMLISFIIIFSKYFNNVPEIGPNLAIASLSSLYVVILEYFLLPLNINVQKTINKEIDFDEETDKDVCE